MFLAVTRGRSGIWVLSFVVGLANGHISSPDWPSSSSPQPLYPNGRNRSYGKRHTSAVYISLISMTQQWEIRMPMLLSTRSGCRGLEATCGQPGCWELPSIVSDFRCTTATSFVGTSISQEEGRSILSGRKPMTPRRRQFLGVSPFPRSFLFSNISTAMNSHLSPNQMRKGVAATRVSQSIAIPHMYKLLSNNWIICRLLGLSRSLIPFARLAQWGYAKL
jgi:hypothetical protein